MSVYNKLFYGNGINLSFESAPGMVSSPYLYTASNQKLIEGGKGLDMRLSMYYVCATSDSGSEYLQVTRNTR